MANFEVTGFIAGIKYNENNVVVTLMENRLGYKRKDGTIVRSSVLNWRITYKTYFKKYIAGTFSSGMYVTIKGIVLPHSFDGTETIDGYTVYGQTIDLAPLPKNVKREQKMQKDSQFHSQEQPNLAAYKADDF